MTATTTDRLVHDLTDQLREVRDAARQILAGHATYAWESNYLGVDVRRVGCACTGCQIVRASGLLTAVEMGPEARDALDGLDGEQIDYGMRWRPCVPQLRQAHPTVCDKGKRRDHFAGLHHEHLIRGDGIPVGCEPEEECPF